MESEVKMHLKYQELKLICKTCSLEEVPPYLQSGDTDDQGSVLMAHTDREERV